MLVHIIYRVIRQRQPVSFKNVKISLLIWGKYYVKKTSRRTCRDSLFNLFAAAVMFRKNVHGCRIIRDCQEVEHFYKTLYQDYDFEYFQQIQHRNLGTLSALDEVGEFYN